MLMIYRLLETFYLVSPISRIEVARNPSGIFLCQRKYTLEIISETSLLGAKLAFTLNEPTSLSKSNGLLFYLHDGY